MSPQDINDHKNNYYCTYNHRNFRNDDENMRLFSLVFTATILFFFFSSLGELQADAERFLGLFGILRNGGELSRNFKDSVDTFL